jgi:GT2 family glycosyltransferase
LVTHNAPVHCETALRSVFNRTNYPSLEAVVVDNGSAPEGVARLEAVIAELRGEGHEIRLVKNKQNLWFSHGQNQAIKEARGEYVCLLNDDTEIPSGSESWLSGLVWCLETMNAGTVTPVTVGRDGHIYCAGAYGGGGHHLREEKDSLDLMTAPRLTEWNNMACCLTRRRFFDEVGFLKEEGEYVHYKSDLEWGQRLTEATGLRHWVHPARVHHYEKEALREPANELQASSATRIPASVVMVAYNNLDYTAQAIEAVLANTAPPFEFVLVDNGSSDGTAEYFMQLRDQLGGGVAVQVLSNKENLGYTLAANQGIRAARGCHVVLLNNDTQVRPGWLAGLLDAARSEPKVAIVTAKILCMDGRVQNAGGIYHHPDGSYTLPFALEDRLAPTVTKNRKVESAGGPCMLLTRELLNEVGLFDAAYSPAYFEDSDLGMRARSKGFSLLYAHSSEVLHVGKATASVVAQEGKLPIWEKFETNKKLFYERWGKELEADERARRRVAQTNRARRQRILLCYNKNPNTTAAYCEAALRRAHDVVTAGKGQDLDLGDVTTEELIDAAGNVDLLLAIEGENYLPREISQASCTTAWWAIDAHIHAARGDEGYFALAREFDHVFLAQKDYAPIFHAQAIETTWLPLACEPSVHKRFGLTRDLDVVFVGNVLPIHMRRRALLDRLASRFRVDRFEGVYREEMAKLFSRAKIVFNCSLAGDLNMRVFEALSCGSLLVTDRAGNGMGEFFGDEEHLVHYGDENLEEVVARYLDDPGAREEIAERGQRLVINHHTYAHRMSDLVERIERTNVAEVVSR